MAKGNGSGESKPKWNNVQRMIHQNQFVPTAVLTRTGRIPVNTARPSSTNKDVIVNGDLEEEPAPTTRETSAPPAPKTAKQLAARRNQERVKSILLLAIPDEYLLKFHNVADAKSL
ncbi:hypothetical protein Tco_1118147 [Tanacetum coccineum]